MNDRAYYLQRVQHHLTMLERADEPAVIRAHRGLAELYLDCANAAGSEASTLQEQSPANSTELISI